MPSRRLFSVDPSLTCSGWALFCLERDSLLAVGKVRSMPALHALSLRLKDLQDRICEVFDSLTLGCNDILICEAPTTMRDPGAAFKVEQVRCIFETVARDRRVTVPGRINPRSVHHEVMGLKGRQQKRAVVKVTAVSVAKSLFGSTLEQIGFPATESNLKKHQDVVDAILLGYLGSVKIRSAERAGQPLEEAFHRPRYAARRAA